MVKNVVVCIDGTRNKPGQTDTLPGGVVARVAETNVHLAWKALTEIQPTPFVEPPEYAVRTLTEGSGVALYMAGVGTDGGFFGRLYDAATGYGTAERIRRAYGFLARECRPGEECRIYCFGFSRGAFAVRSLAGFIAKVGLPNRLDNLDMARATTLYDIYVSGKDFDKDKEDHRDAGVHFLGLWDTVGSLRHTNEPHRCITPENVQHVVHALALDEARQDFRPDLWPASGLPWHRRKEVWFSGAHSNVGGGYADDNLSNIAFFWVMKEAQSRELPVSLETLDRWSVECTNGGLRKSRTRAWGLFEAIRSYVSSPVLTTDRRIDPWQRVHASVVERILDAQLKPRYTPGTQHHADEGFWGQVDTHDFCRVWGEPWNCLNEGESPWPFSFESRPANGVLPTA
jgi:hypothetical protein